MFLRRDIAHARRFVQIDRILSQASAKSMMQPSAEFVRIGDTVTKVGLGWMIDPGDVVQHGGGGPGVRSQLYAHPPSGRVMVLLTNCDKGEDLQMKFAAPIVQSWTGIRPSKPRRQTSR